jgi:hypothetical protein
MVIRFQLQTSQSPLRFILPHPPLWPAPHQRTDRHRTVSHLPCPRRGPGGSAKARTASTVLQLYGLQDDRGESPPTNPCPYSVLPTRTGSPAGGPGGRLRAPSMKWLKAAVELQRQSPAAVVRRWRRSEKGGSRRGKQNLANSCKAFALFSIPLAFSGATARVRARTNGRANEFPPAELHSGC